MKTYETFNKSGFSRFINTPAGRAVRFAAGTGFLLAGLANLKKTGGLVSVLWSLLPLSAGVFDLCYFSGILGGPLSGRKIREMQVPAESIS